MAEQLRCVYCTYEIGSGRVYRPTVAGPMHQGCFNEKYRGVVWHGDCPPVLYAA